MGFELWLLCLQGSGDACMNGKKEEEGVGVPNMDQQVMAKGKLDLLYCRNTSYVYDYAYCHIIPSQLLC
jgi:hypothetical protein